MSPGEVTSKCRLTRRARGKSSRQRAQQRQIPGAGFEKPSVGEAKADGAAESGSCTLGGHRRDVSFLYGGGTAESQQVSGQKKDVLGVKGRLVSKWPVCHVT